MARTAMVLGDRWTLLILREAFYGVQRYADMLADLGASRAVLSERLTKLVDDGLMTRQPYTEPGSRTRDAYVLTQRGRDTALILIAMMQWGEQHLLGTQGPVKITATHSGAELRAGLLDSEGSPTPLAAARLLPRETGPERSCPVQPAG